MEQCLCALHRSLRNVEGEVFVVDNHSSDGSVAYLSPLFPTVRFIENPYNAGFGKACNQPLELVSGRYVLYLNPDTIIGEDTIVDCLRFLDRHPLAGLVGCRMIDGAGRFLPESKRSFPSATSAFFKLSGLSYLFKSSAFFNRYALGHLPQKNDVAVDVLCGAFMMGGAEKLRALQGFDEDFFMYGEDIDLCYRMSQLGLQNYYLGSTTIVHFKGESSQQHKLKHRKAFYSAMQIFISKHATNSSRMLMLPLLSLAIIMRAVLSFFFIPFQVLQRAFRNRLGNPLPNFSPQFIAKACQSGSSCSGNATLFAISNEHPAKRAIDGLSENSSSDYYWHHCGSLSVVGSNDKNETGCAFALSTSETY